MGAAYWRDHNYGTLCNFELATLWMRLALPYRSRIAIPYKVQLHYSRRGSMHHYTLELGIHKGKFYSPYHGTLVPHIQRTLVPAAGYSTLVPSGNSTGIFTSTKYDRCMHSVCTLCAHGMVPPGQGS